MTANGSKIGWLLALLLLAMTAAGCGRSATPEAEATPTPAAAPATPEATPSPEPTALPTWTPIPAPVDGALTVDAAQDLGPISPLIFGTNYGPWVSLRPETLPLAAAAGRPIIRYPGGEWGDKNDLQGYQIDQFVDLARRMGAEPYIHVRFLDSTPEKAADLVRYANVDHDYAIRYWAIGNEPSLYEDAGYLWDAAAFSQEWRRFAAAMRAVDPDIILMGPETHQFTGTPDVDPVDSSGRDWLRTFLAANGDLLDMVSIHRYPFPVDEAYTPATIPQLRANAAEWDDTVRNLRQAIREETGRDLPVAITEVNSHWTHAVRGEATPDSFFSALWWGDVLGRLIRQRVDVVTQFLLVSGGESGYGIFAKYEPRPVYYVYQLYKRFGDGLVYADSGVADLSIYAARRDDGALTLMVVNLADEEQTAPLHLAGFDPAGKAQVWRFDAEHQAEQLDDFPLTDGADLTLPGRSMTLFVLP
jgi:hypothetical protein